MCSISKEVLNILIPLMVRQSSPEHSRGAHHERNQYVTVHPELVEGFNQRFPKDPPKAVLTLRWATHSKCII
jgi:hypothetical protein